MPIHFLLSATVLIRRLSIIIMIAPKNKKEVRTLLCVLCYQSNNQKRVYFVLLSLSDISRKNYSQEYKQIIDLIENYFYLYIK